MEKNKLSPGQKAKRTGQWAKIMTKWKISHSIKGKNKWQYVSFEGPNGGESKGIVDFIAIRRNHNPKELSFPMGDLFEIILIQVKGGNACMPTQDDINRLIKVGKYYCAKRILLSEWKIGNSLIFKELINGDWIVISASEAFS